VHMEITDLRDEHRPTLERVQQNLV
jgi:hypothetical protein